MTSVAAASSATALRRAAVQATLAPSVHNTQPWSMRLHGGRLDLRVDLSRRLAVLDPTGRQLTISCGAALLNARLSLAAAELDVQVDRLPDPGDRTLLARITPREEQHSPLDSRVSLASIAALRSLNGFVESRRTNRHPFTDGDVPTAVLDVLAQAVHAEHGELAVVAGPAQCSALASISTRARAGLDADQAYRVEARGWARDDARSCGERHRIVIVGSPGDRPIDWVHAGEALERMLVEITRQGLVAGPIAQTVVTAADRADLRSKLGLTMTPQVVLAIGRAPASLASRRRRLGDVLLEDV